MVKSYKCVYEFCYDEINLAGELAPCFLLPPSRVTLAVCAAADYAAVALADELVSLLLVD